MPIGVIVNALFVVFGGIAGVLAGNKLSAEFKEKINMIFGACAMTMGISSIVLMENMPAVILSVILGTILGFVVHLGDKIQAAAGGMQRIIGKFIINQPENP